MSSGVCYSFKSEVLQGIHALTTDTLKCALFTSSYTGTPATTTAYSTTNEMTGTGYTAGGVTVTSPTVTLTGATAYFTAGNINFTTTTVNASYALIYNSSKSNRAIAIIDFGGNVTETGGTFTLNMPTSAVGFITYT